LTPLPLVAIAPAFPASGTALVVVSSEKLGDFLLDGLLQAAAGGGPDELRERQPVSTSIQ